MKILFCPDTPFSPRVRESRGVTAEDYFGFVFIADPHISLDGRQVAYTLTRIDTPANRRVSSIGAVPTNGSSEPRQLFGGRIQFDRASLEPGRNPAGANAGELSGVQAAVREPI